MRKRWTQQEIDLLIKLYPDRGNAYVSEFLHRTPRACQLKANGLGVRKSAEYAERQRKANQYPKGHKPFNAGRKWDQFMSEQGQRNAAKTQFKPGVENTASPTYRQPGFEMLRSPDKLGRRYWWVKPHDGRRMMPKHRYIWEQAHGAIPKGHNVQFKDGNPLNCVLDNLYLISRAKQVRKNYDDLPDERKAAARAKMRENRNKSIRADRLRLKWGMEPLGRLVKRVRK